MKINKIKGEVFMKKCLISIIFIILIIGVGFSGCIEEENNNIAASIKKLVNEMIVNEKSDNNIKR